MVELSVVNNQQTASVNGGFQWQVNSGGSSTS